MSNNMLTKENLFIAFWELYKNNNISHISVGSVTKRAGYNRSTFYEYFVDIYDLLNQLEQGIIDNFCKIINDRAFTNSRFNGLEIYVQGFIDAYLKYGDDFAILLGDNGDPSFTRKIVNHMNNFWNDRAGNVDMDIEMINEYACPAMLSVLSTWHRTGKSISLEQLMNIVLKMIRVFSAP